MNNYIIAVVFVLHLQLEHQFYRSHNIILILCLTKLIVITIPNNFLKFRNTENSLFGLTKLRFNILSLENKIYWENKQKIIVRSAKAPKLFVFKQQSI